MPLESETRRTCLHPHRTQRVEVQHPNVGIRGDYVLGGIAQQNRNRLEDVREPTGDGALPKSAHNSTSDGPNKTNKSLRSKAVQLVTTSGGFINTVLLATLHGDINKTKQWNTIRSKNTEHHQYYTSTRRPDKSLDTFTWRRFREHETDLTLTGMPLGDGMFASRISPVTPASRSLSIPSCHAAVTSWDRGRSVRPLSDGDRFS